MDTNSALISGKLLLEENGLLPNHNPFFLCRADPEDSGQEEISSQWEERYVVHIGHFGGK